MTSALELTAGRMRLINPATGLEVFDTDARLWIQTNWISSADIGPVSLPARTATWVANRSLSGVYTPIDVTNDVAVATINTAATVVDGMMKVSAAALATQNTYKAPNLSSETSTFGAAFYGQWMQCSGTLVGDTFCRARNSGFWVTSGALAADWPSFRNAMITYTWIAAGGVLTLRERAVLGPFNGNGYDTVSHSEINIPARTVDFRLFVGSFV